jgi:hypothetical protein
MLTTKGVWGQIHFSQSKYINNESIAFMFKISRKDTIDGGGVNILEDQ